MQNNIKINWNFLYGILMGFLVLLTLGTLKIQIPIWGIIGVLILSQPLVMKSGNVYSLWGGFSENSIYSLVPIIQSARYDALGLLGVSLFQKAGCDSFLAFGISLFQKSGNNSFVAAGIILFQSASNDCRLELGVSLSQKSGSDSFLAFGISLFQEAGNDCRLELGVIIFQNFRNKSKNGICAFVLVSSLDA